MCIVQDRVGPSLRAAAVGEKLSEKRKLSLSMSEQEMWREKKKKHLGYIFYLILAISEPWQPLYTISILTVGEKDALHHCLEENGNQNHNTKVAII